MKFEIKIEGINADLNDRGYDLEILNPTVDFDAPVGSKATGIILPFTPTNRRIFGHINDPKVVTNKRLYYAEKYLGSNLIEKGFVYMRSAEGGFNIDFTTNIAEFFGAIQQKRLSDIDLGTIVEHEGWNRNESITHTWDYGGYVLPVIDNSLFYDKEPPTGWDGKMNSYDDGYLASTPIVPMFYLKYILNIICEISGVTISGDFWDDPDFESLLIFNTHPAGTENKIEIRKHLPDMTVGELILGLRKLFNLAMYFDTRRKKMVMKYMTIHNISPSRDWTKKFGDIKSGTPINTGGVELMFESDGNDGLSKELFFAAYSDNVSDDETVKVNIPFTTLMMSEGGVPMCKMTGVTNTQPDRNFGARLISYRGNAQADNKYSEIIMNGEGLFERFWNKENHFRRQSFYIENLAILTAGDIGWISGIFRGEIDDQPVVHVQGLDWVIKKIIIPTGMPDRSMVSMYRL